MGGVGYVKMKQNKGRGSGTNGVVEAEKRRMGLKNRNNI